MRIANCDKESDEFSNGKKTNRANVKIEKPQPEGYNDHNEIEGKKSTHKEQGEAIFMTTERNHDPRLSIEQIENMTPQQLAQLLTNLVNVLLRMPNEPLKNLKRVEHPIELDDIDITKNKRPKKPEVTPKQDLPDWLS
jgi:hypothetical protein